MGLTNRQRQVGKAKVGKSKIHGHGCFATHVIKHKEVIFGKRLYRDTKFGGFNHSCNPNIMLVVYRGSIIIVALRNIKRYEELTVDYGLKIVRGYFVAFDKRKFRCNCKAHRK